MYMTTAEIRNAFLNFFESKQHQKVASSSLIPGNDPTLLFTNAGMVQFKETFLGSEIRDYARATSSQRCVRAGGKHNDLENVGYTARHHTFFEMLGNFSFGDYFKRDAIQYAWEFLTGVLKLPKDKLWVTVFEEDDEAADIWIKEIGVDPNRLSRIGAKDNFWSMGDTGPCGPCTEIFYDHGEEIWGGPPGTPEEDGDRYIEIWNLVFMQFNRHADGTMEPLPKPSVDTGMGLERIAAIMQDVHSNYEIDLFQRLIKEAAVATGAKDLNDKSLRVIADHIRSCSFLIADGVMPSNEGRGYVLRRIIRRGIRHGRKLGATDIFFYKLVAPLAELMGDAYPELHERRSVIEKMLTVEEEQFVKTIDRGLIMLDDVLSTLEGKEIPGDVVFKLYDTYGFPADLTADVARERDYTIDEVGFEKAMEQQRQTARESGKFGTDYNQQVSSEQQSTFNGYTDIAGASKVAEIFVDGQSVQALDAGQDALIILEETPFYAESGGQVGDTGTLAFAAGQFDVQDTIKVGKAIAHKGQANSPIAIGDMASSSINTERREKIKLNHSATHLMHAALQNLLGEHVTQKGSYVGPDRLRFDFSHFEGVTATEIVQIEAMVNAEIRKNHDLTAELMPIEAAKEKGAMALFGEKYDDEVRVISMGDFSMELCGGTHVSRTGDIGLFKILSEGGIAAGVRRIEAVTGDDAIQAIHSEQAKLAEMAKLLKSDEQSLVEKLSTLLERSKGLEKELAQLKDKLSSQAGESLISQVKEIHGVKALVSQLDDADPKALRNMVDDLKNKIGSGVICLSVVQGDKVSLIAGVTKDLTGKVKAGELVNMVAQQVGGKGGGRPDMAQAGGSDPQAVPAAMNSVHTWLEEKLA
ncbi:alanine--tRNA ligase [Algicola sagamiensis]|uniref:alanine--tRNA ligase n=1 Tax=Algicola sagamiensis TaxID=163869 RepID=UPI000379030D|nr:alanine--tRNA ligase [Algicola sagamiensis]